MSASADLHALVHTTALVLRRGLGVAALGVLIVLLGVAAGTELLTAGMVLAIVELAPWPYSDRPPIEGYVTIAVLASGVAATASAAVVLATFFQSLKGKPRLYEVIRCAVRRWPRLVLLSVLTALPLGVVVGSCGLLAFSFQTGAGIVLLAPVGLGLLILGLWLLAEGILLNAVAVVAGLSFHRVGGGRTLKIAVGATPILLAGTFIGQRLLPVVELPEEIVCGILVVALLAIAVLTAAVSVAGYAVASRDPPREDVPSLEDALET